MINTINKWKSILQLSDWQIDTESINPNQVSYPSDCVGDERFFIGIEKDEALNKAVIYHDRPLYEEAIVHELLHVKYPEKSEEWVNKQTHSLLRINKIQDHE